MHWASIKNLNFTFCLLISLLSKIFYWMFFFDLEKIKSRDFFLFLMELFRKTKVHWSDPTSHSKESLSYLAFLHLWIRTMISISLEPFSPYSWCMRIFLIYLKLESGWIDSKSLESDLTRMRQFWFQRDWVHLKIFSSRTNVNFRPKPMF